jgi:hypothetical protein
MLRGDVDDPNFRRTGSNGAHWPLPRLNRAPTPSDVQREQRESTEMGIVALRGAYTNELKQVERIFILISMRRSRKVIRGARSLFSTTPTGAN